MKNYNHTIEYMKSNNSLKKESRFAWFPNRRIFRSLVLGALIVTGIQSKAQQDLYSIPSWWFGAAVGGNVNFYNGTTQQLNSGFMAPTAFHDGMGVGLYVAPLIEYYRANTRLGFMLQAGYDNRRGKFEQVDSPCNCPEDLKTEISYLTIEPSLRFAPFRSNFYLYAGPRFAFNMEKSFNYKMGINPDFPDQIPSPEVEGDLSSVHKNLISMQIGAGVDLPINSQNNRTQVVLSPFVSFQPYFGQDPRSIESLTVTTVRAGFALKFGRGKKIEVPAEVIVPVAAEVVVVDPEVTFTVNAPVNIPVERRVREVFPLRNYVFFNSGSTEIPNRYMLLRKDQVKEFKEDQLDLYIPENLSGRSKRQMTVYYNVINVLGDRMIKFPSTTITLVGSSEKGPKDGRAMAQSMKDYLVNVFGIDPSRISVKGVTKPEISSILPGETSELALRYEGDRRVTIMSSSDILLMEYQHGPGAPLKPVEIITVQEAPLDSYITFNADGADEAFTSWSMEIRDENEKVQYYGPYTQEEVGISGKSILGSRPEGDYKVTMIGQTKSGKVVRKEATAHMVLWTPPSNDEVMRFSILYEYDNSKAINIYEKYLTDVVMPKIPQNGTVLIHGYSDIIGNEAWNQKLSLARANDVKKILGNALSKAGRSDVKFEVHGYGEDLGTSPFDNKYPEGRFYNRTVIIDLIPR